MECFEFGVNIQNDVNGKLAKTVEHVAGFNKLKAKILAGYVNSQEFLDYCINSESFDSTKSLADNHQNVVRSLLRKYFRDKHKNVLESAAKAQAETMQGFSSINAKNIAIDYTANVINRIYYNTREKNKSINVKFNKLDIINQSIVDIENEYINTCVIPLYKTSKATNENGKYLNEFRDAHNEYNKLNKQLNTLKSDAKNNKDAIKDLKDKVAEAKRTRYNIAYNLINEHGNIVQKNYANMLNQIKGNPNKWFEKVFESSKLVSIVNEFEHTLKSDKLVNENYQDENDYINPDAENVDEMSKSWEDKLWSSFDKAVAADL